MQYRFSGLLFFIRQVFVLGLLSFFFIGIIRASTDRHFIQDTLNPLRLKAGISALGVGYSGSTIGLYKSWYAPYHTGDFHFYNDWGEWKNIDKAGHIFSAYFQAELLYRGARWVGLKKSQASIYSGGIALLFMSTIEVMDGFSDGWGFSLPDMGANLLGVGLFVGQEYVWEEQFFRMKWSASPSKVEPYYAIGNKGTSIPLDIRRQMLFGKTLSERLLKDYNGTHVWLSCSMPKAITETGYWPEWLTLALGVGAGNLYGGYENSWVKDGERFVLPKTQFPRYTSIYLSPDINWLKVPAKNNWLKSVFVLLNVFKLPAPTVEYRTTGTWVWHWVLF